MVWPQTTMVIHTMAYHQEYDGETSFHRNLYDQRMFFIY